MRSAAKNKPTRPPGWSTVWVASRTRRIIEEYAVLKDCTLSGAAEELVHAGAAKLAPAVARRNRKKKEPR